MISIQRGDAADIAQVMPIMTQAFDPSYSEAWTAAQCLSLLAMPGSQLLLASIKDATCGFAITRWVGEEEELLLIGVEQHHQRQKIGQSLLEEVFALARQCGRKTVFLEVRENNRAIALYERIGFVPVGRRKDYYRNQFGDRFEAITMRFSL